MGCSEEINNYWMAYREILIDSDLEKIENNEKVYLISTESIPIFINLIEKSKILDNKNNSGDDKKKICEKFLSELFTSNHYKPEKNIKIYSKLSECLEIVNNKKKNEFIIVNEYFLLLTNIDKNKNKNKLLKIDKNKNIYFTESSFVLGVRAKRIGIYEFIDLGLKNDYCNNDNKSSEESCELNKSRNINIKKSKSKKRNNQNFCQNKNNQKEINQEKNLNEEKKLNNIKSKDFIVQSLAQFNIIDNNNNRNIIDNNNLKNTMNATDFNNNMIENYNKNINLNNNINAISNSNNNIYNTNNMGNESENMYNISYNMNNNEDNNKNNIIVNNNFNYDDNFFDNRGNNRFNNNKLDNFMIDNNMMDNNIITNKMINNNIMDNNMINNNIVNNNQTKNMNIIQDNFPINITNKDTDKNNKKNNGNFFKNNQILELNENICSSLEYNQINLMDNLMKGNFQYLSKRNKDNHFVNGNQMDNNETNNPNQIMSNSNQILFDNINMKKNNLNITIGVEKK